MSKKRTQPSEPLIPCKVSVEPQHMVALRAKDKTVFLVDRNCALVSQRCADYLRHVEMFIAQLLAIRLNKISSVETGNNNSPTSTQSNLLSTNTTFDGAQKMTMLSDEEYEKGMQRKLPFCLFDQVCLPTMSVEKEQSEQNEQHIEHMTDVTVVYKTIAEVIDERERAGRMSRVGGSILIPSSAMSTLVSNSTVASNTGNAALLTGNANSVGSSNTITNEIGRSVSAHSTSQKTAAHVVKPCYLYSTLEWSDVGILYPLIDFADISSSSLELGVMYMYEKYRVDAEIDKRAMSAGAIILPSSTFLHDHADKRLELLAISRLLLM